MNYNFEIKSDQEISQLFLKNNCCDFHSASEFIRNLSYRRNLNKDNLATVFIDGCGTCSTKHAVLQKLAEENYQTDFKLILGIFKMNGNNTPQIKSVLETYNIDYIPEAHNYLKFKNEVLDFTKRILLKMILSITFWKKQKSNLIKSTNSKLNFIKTTWKNGSMKIQKSLILWTNYGRFVNCVFKL